jgi:hypothetical protein
MTMNIRVTTSLNEGSQLQTALYHFLEVKLDRLADWEKHSQITAVTDGRRMHHTLNFWSKDSAAEFRALWLRSRSPAGRNAR